MLPSVLTKTFHCHFFHQFTLNCDLPAVCTVNATDDIQFNPNNSMAAIEGILSPDGRVFGKMGHSERVGTGLYRNVPGNYEMKLFLSAVRYFQ